MKTATARSKQRTKPSKLPPYRPQKLSPDLEAALRNGEFDFLTRFKSREKIRVAEAASDLSMSQDFIRDLVRAGELEILPLTGKGSSPTYMITTRSFLRWMVSHSNMTPRALKETLKAFMESLDQEQLALAKGFITEREARLAHFS